MPAPTPPYMRFYVEAYRRATLSMTFEEQGVYMRLLTTLWSYGGAIPDDDRLISKALPIQIQKWQKVKPALMEHLQQEPPGFLSQKTLVDQYQSVTRGKTPNNDSNSPQPEGGPNPGQSQPPYQQPPQGHYQGQPQGQNGTAASSTPANPLAFQGLADFPATHLAHTLARALDRSRFKQDHNNNSRFLDDGGTEPCGKILSEQEAKAFVDDALDAFEKYRLNPPGDLSVIESWVRNGCDMHRHILPAIRGALARHGGNSPPPKSWKYFTHEVYGRKKKEKANG